MTAGSPVQVARDGAAQALALILTVILLLPRFFGSRRQRLLFASNAGALHEGGVHASRTKAS